MNWYSRIKLSYRYIGQCDRVRDTLETNERWKRMMKESEPVSLEDFQHVIDASPILDDEETLEDFLSTCSEGGLYKSVWGSHKCYFVQCNGFEFIWV